MELIDYVRMLGRRWKWWVSLVVLGTLAGFAYASAVPKTYTATTDAFVASSPPNDSTTANSELSKMVLDRMPSYLGLVHDPTVLQGVLKDVPTSLTQQQLASRLSAVRVPKTVVLQVTAKSSRPTLAAELSAAAAKRLGAAIQSLETPAHAKASPVRVIITRPAPVPVKPSSPNRVLSIVLGLLAGLGLGLISASLRDQAARTAPVAETSHRGSPAHAAVVVEPAAREEDIPPPPSRRSQPAVDLPPRTAPGTT